MPIEAATYLNDLNTSYPQSTDKRSTADDHLRLIKAVLKTGQFPNFSATSVDATVAEINVLNGATAGTAVADKAVVIDSSKDISGLGAVTCSGLAVSATAAAVFVRSTEAGNNAYLYVENSVDGDGVLLMRNLSGVIQCRRTDGAGTAVSTIWETGTTTVAVTFSGALTSSAVTTGTITASAVVVTSSLTIPAGSIDTSELAALSVTTAKLYAGSVTSAKLATTSTMNSRAITAGASYTLPAGQYMIGASLGGNIQVEIATSATAGWSATCPPGYGGQVWSDGTNTRLTNTDGALSDVAYWRVLS